MAEDTISAFKAAMARLVSSVTIVSAAGPGDTQVAMTATSPTSLTMDPPAMLVCVNRSASIHAVLSAGGAFCINILGSTQDELARRCGAAAARDTRFKAPGWALNADGVPYLEKSCAAIFCTPERFVTFGTHDIVIGAVDAIHLGPTQPFLLYADRQFHALAPANQ